MAQQVLEGTWEEIRAHESELAGQHVRLTIITHEGLTQPPQAPSVIFDPSSDSILTDEIRDVLDPFIALLLADIQQHAVSASKVDIWGMEYPNDGTSRIWVHLWINCDSDEEMWRYYEDFLTRAEGWLKSLNVTHRSIFSRKVSFGIRRVKNA